MSLAPTFTIRPEMLGQTLHNPWSTPIPVHARALRTHDCDIATQWARVETAAGAYNWADLDRLANHCRKRGIAWVDTILGTPELYTSSRRADSYGQRGGGSMPTNLEALGRFVQARVARYPDLISVIEPLNEPSLSFEPCMGSAPDWHALVRYARMVYAATKIEAPNVQVASPSFLAHHPEQLAAYLQAGGGAWCDAINVHSYGMDLARAIAVIDTFKRVMRDSATLPPGMPLVLTECGQQPVHGSAFLQLSRAKQGREWARCMLYAASQGCTAFVTYSDDPGQAQQDSGEVFQMRDAFNAAAAIVGPHVGRKIRPAVGFRPGNAAFVIGGRTVVV